MWPALPVSLRHLTLEGSPSPVANPPKTLRLGGLTRLETLTLAGCANKALDEDFLGDYTGEPPLPPSLRVLRFEHPMTLRWGCMSPPEEPDDDDLYIEASVRLIECRTDVDSDGNACSVMPHGAPTQVAGRGIRRSSEQPPEGTLSMELNQLMVRHGSGPLDLAFEYQAYAVDMVCTLLHKAPGSYREVRLCCGSLAPVLQVGVAWKQTGSGRCENRFGLGREGMAGLAAALQQYELASGSTLRLSADRRQCIITQGA